jgi:hypothetical protein
MVRDKDTIPDSIVALRNAFSEAGFSITIYQEQLATDDTIAIVVGARGP